MQNTHGSAHSTHEQHAIMRGTLVGQLPDATPAMNAKSRLQRMRQTLRGISETIFELQHGAAERAETLGWNHPAVIELQEAVSEWQARRAEQLRQIELGEQLVASEEADQARYEAERATAEAAWRAAGGTGRFIYYTNKQQLTPHLEARWAQHRAHLREKRVKRAQSEQAG